MDPVTAVCAAEQIAGLCLQLVNQIKQLIEAARGAKQALFNLISRLERMRLLLNEFKSLAQRLQNSPQHTITLAFNDSNCKDTVTQLQGLINKVSKEAEVHEYWMRFRWTRHQEAAAMLLSRLAGHESDLNSVLQFVAARSTITTQEEIEKLRKQIDSCPPLEDPLPPSEAEPLPLYDAGPSEAGHSDSQPRSVDHCKLSSVEGDASSLAVGKHFASSLQWLACPITDAYGPEYLREREILADASWRGDWKAVFGALDAGKTRFGEQWENAFRLKPLSGIPNQTMWTPLHQSAYMGASTDVVESLIKRGASRTLRTTRADPFLPYRDMTAFEIADSMGYADLRAVLTPKILHYLPDKTAVSLQDQLHKLLTQLMGDDIQRFSLRLPELSVLTELDNPTMNVILPEAASLRSITIYLDGRELLVRNDAGIYAAHRRDSYRISTSGWEEIENALSFSRRF